MIELNKVYHSDCIELIKRIDDSCIDLIITSPPYNLKIKYDNYDDCLSWEEYLQWCEKWLIGCYRILKDDGKLCLNHYINFSDVEKKDRFPLFDLMEIQKKIKFNVSKLIIWNDTQRSTLTAWGSWLSASSPYIQTPTEGILISYKNQWKKLNKGISTINKDEFIEAVSGVWKLGTDSKSLTKASFPEKLPKLCIQLLTYKNDIIFDPFSGSGTTCCVAKKLQRRYIGCDISKNYCKTANQRIDQIQNDEVYEL